MYSICEMDFHVGLVTYNNNNKYYFGSENVSYSDAYLQCKDRGGYLVTFQDEAEWRFVTREARVKYVNALQVTAEE